MKTFKLALGISLNVRQEQQDFLNNADSYGHEKLQGEERLVQELPAGRRCLILRLPDVIGPFDSTQPGRQRFSLVIGLDGF